jgi:hypothetical protein
MGQRWASHGACYDQTPNTVCGKQAGARRQAASGVDDRPCRVRPLNPTDGQLGIVSQSGTGTDDHNIDQSPQPVQMGQSCRAINVMGMSGFRGDPAIQGLADLPNEHHPV